ncbi:MAG: SigE family RNA polymerase sigma factor [Actinomycetota bacterium]|nr:SigE family RNA polymerase sigma factor [Actinomycetota bacterium]
MTGLEATGAPTAVAGGRAAGLYRRHVAGALRLAYLLTGDRALAEDLVQDAFVRMFGRFQDLRRPEAFAFYLRRTVANLAKDHFRRLQRERTAARRHGDAGAEEDADLLRLPGHNELLHALQRLPARQKAAVVLRFCEGLSEHETAEVLATSAGAVNSLVSRGLAALRREMGGRDR